MSSSEAIVGTYIQYSNGLIRIYLYSILIVVYKWFFFYFIPLKSRLFEGVVTDYIYLVDLQQQLYHRIYIDYIQLGSALTTVSVWILEPAIKIPHI